MTLTLRSLLLQSSIVLLVLLSFLLFCPFYSIKIQYSQRLSGAHSLFVVENMRFCPACGNLLLIDEGSAGMRYFCPTCPYAHNINKTYSSSLKLKKKAVDDILGGSDAWDNVDRTSARCPHCSHDTAYFMQIQIRSADEPMTTFYKCVSCKKQWNDK